MSHLLLAKPELEEGWINASVGEAHLIKEAMLSCYDIENRLPEEINWEYPLPDGNRELIGILEEKYGGKVIITNGAKQGLGAVFYALEKLGCRSVGMRNPYWALIPPLVRFHGLEPVPSSEGVDSFLAILPNNPDGYMMNQEAIDQLSDRYSNEYLIVDSVYYTHSYLPESLELVPFGDVQLYSASKAYGLSGLRIGWIVCHNSVFYPLIRDYLEMMTVGVSEVSQQFFLNQILRKEEEKPSIKRRFEKKAFYALKEARKLFAGIGSSILELPDDFEEQVGMFAWCKLKDSEALREAKIHAIEGAPFGQPGFVRLNLALPKETLRELILRLG